MILNGSPDQLDDFLVGKNIENAVSAHEHEIHSILELLLDDVRLASDDIMNVSLLQHVLLDFIAPDFRKLIPETPTNCQSPRPDSPSPIRELVFFLQLVDLLHVLVVLGLEDEILAATIAEKFVELSSFLKNPVHFCEIVWLVVFGDLFVVLSLVIGYNGSAIAQIDEEERGVDHHQGADASTVGVDLVRGDLFTENLVVELSIELNELGNDELL